MIKYKSIVCSTPNCQNKIFIRIDGKHPSKYCRDCKKNYPLTVLRLQTLHEMPIKELLIDVCKTYNFNSGGTISRILGINKKKLEEWLKTYFDLNSWDEFKKIHKCRSNSCYLIKCSSLFSSRYKNKYYLIQKLKKDFDVCSCLYKTSLEDNPKEDYKILIKIPDLQKLIEIQKASTYLKK